MITLKHTENLDSLRQKSAGFTLVEIAISMVIISSLVAMGATLIPRLAYQFQEKGTYEKIDYIHRAISAYVQKHNRIPCPANPNRAAAAEPYGTELGSGANGQNVGACPTLANRQGIVPFRTLGLNYDDVRDSFGNLITYRVSRTPTIPYTDPINDDINNWCRHEPKWHNGVNDIDPDKAAFCCGYLPNGNINTVDDDIRVEGPFSYLPGSSRSRNPLGVTPAFPGGTAAEYSAIGGAAPTTATLLNTSRPSYAVYTLISHGPNGRGHYDYQGTQQLTLNRFLSANERNNALNNTRITYVQDNSLDLPNAGDPGPGLRQSLSVDQIDDIVSWRNAFQIYSAVGNASCAEAR